MNIFFSVFSLSASLENAQSFSQTYGLRNVSFINSKKASVNILIYHSIDIEQVNKH